MNRHESTVVPDFREVQYLATMWLFGGTVSDRIDQNM